MVFSSVTPFVDHHNWHQQLQQPNPQGNCGGGENINFHSPPPVPPQHGDTGGGSEGSIRPGSMVDRARLAKLPMPEPGLNCPRCDSTNTKFCYFNNYSLTQPRHFCKACRRYWTRGGALRNVPVGGGCRRNNKRSSNKNKRQRSNSPTQNGNGSGSPLSNENITKGSHQLLPASLQFPFMSSSTYGGAVGSNNNNITSSNNLGVFPQNEILMGNSSFRLGNGNNNLSNMMMLSMGSTTGDGSWRLPLLAGFEVPNNNNNNTNLFHYDQTTTEAPAAAASSSMVDNSEVKVEESKKQAGMNLSRQVDHQLGRINSSEINQAWQLQVVQGNNWAGFNSTTSSSSNPTTNFI